jgi:hypothetical protein
VPSPKLQSSHTLDDTDTSTHLSAPHLSHSQARIDSNEDVVVGVNKYRYTVQCSAVQCDTMPCGTIPCSAAQYKTVQHTTMQYNTIQYNTIQYNTIRYTTIQYDTIQCNTIQCNTTRYYAIKTRIVKVIKIILLFPSLLRLPVGSETKHDVLSIDNTMVRESQIKRLDEMKVRSTAQRSILQCSSVQRSAA